MAQVIDHYTATSTSRCYIRSEPDGTGVMQIESGTNVYMWSTVQTDSHYCTYAPASGYIKSWEVETPVPVYKTVTDICTAPTSITLNADTKLLTIVGGAGGDLNTLVGWGVGWRDKPINTETWGAWSTEQVITGRTMTVSAPVGYARQFRARTRGSAGADYYSEYTYCAALLYGNTAPKAPTATHPANNAVSHSKEPVIIINCPADPNGDTMTLKRQVDGGSWVAVKTVKSGTVYDKLPSMAGGAHTIAYTLTDAYGLVSPTLWVKVTVAIKQWARDIAAGTVIANKTISHCADISELQAAVNVLRKYYGLSEMTLPGTIGYFVSWRSQMMALQTAIDQSFAVAAVAAPAWVSVPAWPTAAVINQIRVAVASA